MLDDAIDGLAEAQIQGAWAPSGASEARRRALLPRQAAADWGTLMRATDYLHALALLP